MKTLMILASFFLAPAAFASSGDCNVLIKKMADASKYCDRKGGDMDAVSACVNAEVTKRTGLSPSEADEKIGACRKKGAEHVEE